MSVKPRPTAALLVPPSSLDHRVGGLNALLKYLFTALLFFIPLYPKFPLFNVPGTYVAIRSEDFIIALLGLTLLLHLRLPLARHFFFKQTITGSLLLYWAIGLVSVIGAIFLTRTALPHLGLLHWARRIEYLVPFFAGLYLAQNAANLRFFTKLLIPIALSVLFYGIAQLYFKAPVISTQNEEFSKGFSLTLQPGINLSSTFAGHYDLAVYLMITLCLGTALLFTYHHRLLQSLHLASLLGLFWLQLHTGSRIAFFATSLMVPLVLLLSQKIKYIPLVLLIAFLGGLSTPSLSGRFGSLVKVIESQMMDKVKGIFDTRGSNFMTVYAVEDPPAPDINTDLPLRPIQQDRSTSIRIDVEWPRALRSFYKNPLLGTGYSSLSLATDNDYVRALGETGILGLISWLLIIVNIAASLIRGLRLPANLEGQSLPLLEKQFLIGSFCLFLGFLLVATFIDVFESSKIATLFWMYTGLSLGIVINRSPHGKTV